MTYPIKSLLLFSTLFMSFAVSAQQLNQQLMRQLDTVNRRDQQFRSAEVQHQAAGDQVKDDENMRRQGVLDQKNMAEIEAIIAKYGYPGKSLVGEQYQSVAFMVIQHADPEMRDKYLPVIRQAAEEGQLKSSSVAIMVDRSRMDKGEKQVYGSQLHETKQGFKIVPIEDEEHVNERRKKVGLSPLETYMKNFHIDYHVPTAGNPNPPELYYVAENRSQSPVELIGGNAALFAKLRFPDEAKQHHVNGSVTVEVIVDKNGKVKSANIARSLGYGCDEEALRMIREAQFKNTTGEDFEIRMRLPFPYQASSGK